MPTTIAVPPPPTPAQVVGAISLGALISGDLDNAESYHLSLLYHLGDIRSLAGEVPVPSLTLAALYWQHRGDDDRKGEWVGHARRVLANVQVRRRGVYVPVSCGGGVRQRGGGGVSDLEFSFPKTSSLRLGGPGVFPMCSPRF